MVGSNDKKTAGKRKRRFRVISHDTAVAINDCRTYFEWEASNKSRQSVSRPVDRTAACFDISSQTVISIRKKLESGEPFYDEEQRDRDMHVPDSFIGVVREAIHDMYGSKERVTLDTLLQRLMVEHATRTQGWKWSRSTLHRFITEKMHYTYGKRRSYYQDLKESVSIAAQRVEYIKKIQQYRAEGRSILYQGETWIHKNMTPANVWLDAEGRGGLKVSQGKGERSIICHIGGENGFVESAKLIFRERKSLKSSDHHSEMNTQVFLEWLTNKVLPAIPPQFVIVIDRATYHSTLTEESKPAKLSFQKLQFAQWLVDHKVVSDGMSTVDDYMTLTRVELAELCKFHEPKPIYQASVLAKEFNCDILFLPVGHPELNPIEMVWAHVKEYMAKHNVNFSLSDIEKHAHDALDAFDESMWQRYMAHCVEIEKKFLAVADEIPLDLDE